MRDRNILTACLVDGDPAVVRRSRRGLRKALLLAVGLEAALLAALLLVPLATPSGLPQLLILTPSPPYRGGANQERIARHTNFRPLIQDHPPDYVFVPSSPGIRPPHNDADILQGGANSLGLPPFGSDNRSSESLGIPGVTAFGVYVEPPPPPQPRQAPRRIHSGGAVEQALLVHRVEPRYPALARQMHLEGTVRLHAVIGIDGAIRELEVESGHPLLARAARDAVLQWRYRPTRLNGEPVEVETTITVIFELGP